jgi:hypothetical protein
MKSYWFCKYPKKNIQLYFTIYIIFNDKIATDTNTWYILCDDTADTNTWYILCDDTALSEEL